MKATPTYPAILLSSSKAVPAQPGPMRAGKDGAQSFRPLVKSSSGNDLLRAPFPGCVPFGHGSYSPSIASPRKHQQQTAPRELVDALEGTGRFPQCIHQLTRRSLLLVLSRSEEHTSELQSHLNLVCRLLLETKKT